MGNIVKPRWVTLFSRTGSEILALEKALGAKSIRITNKTNFSDSLIPEDECIIIDGSEDSLLEALKETDVITLHGYLKIIPSNITKKFNIVNGHPGLITKYPELKGINPQIRALDVVKYPTVGSVLHEVIPEVDEGRIIMTREVPNPGPDNIFEVLAGLNLEMYIDYLKDMRG